jgi:hypothetical protein
MEEKMKEKKLEKAEMKESILTGEALALNDAELEGAAGGCWGPESEAALADFRYTKEILENRFKENENQDPEEILKKRLKENSNTVSRTDPFTRSGQDIPGRRVR